MESHVKSLTPITGRLLPTLSTHQVYAISHWDYAAVSIRGCTFRRQFPQLVCLNCHSFCLRSTYVVLFAWRLSGTSLLNLRAEIGPDGGDR